jgi:hypothetical protein
MVKEISFEELRAKARQIGLKHSDDELERLLPGVNRAKKQADELRQLISPETEPAATFRALQPSPK